MTKRKAIRNIIFVLVITGALHIFLEAARYIQVYELTPLDKRVRDYSLTVQTGFLTSLFSFVTSLASVPFTTILTAVISMVFFAFRKIREGLFLIVSVSGGGLCNYLLKAFYERERPASNQLIEVSGFSFPSGHAMNAVTLYGMTAVLLSHMIRALSLKVVTALFFGLVIAGIGVSRVYLGVHYASDVLSGYMIGVVWVLLVLWGYRYMFVKQKCTN
ncbi:phosphatase PAP2 family protein [Alteribacillus persepolensis]|nr:phosphatase PAP2 family protein [Alteribacillus persepolensis]